MVEGGTAHGWERSMINLCVLGCPPAPYIKDIGGGGRPRRRARQGGSSTPTGSRTPIFVVGVGHGGRTRERGRKGGAALPPCPIRTTGGGGTACPGRPSSSPLRPFRPNILPKGFR